MMTGMGSPKLNAEKFHAARLSVLSNGLLVVLKLYVGWRIGSVAVLSEAAHSATDLVAALIALFAVRASGIPPDDKHPYGHGKVESLSGLIEALLIFGAAIWIVYESVRALFQGTHAHQVGWGMLVMGISALTNALIARRLLAVARKTESQALEADAHHLLTDVWTSLGVLIGLLLVRLTGEARFDPLVALLVSTFIFRAAWSISRDAVQFLLDGRLPDEEIAVVEAILTDDPRVLGWHKLRSRKAGSERHIDLHVQMDDDLSLRDAHALTEELEDRIRDALPNVEVMIHPEPYEEEKRHHEEVPH
jgi:cation diffusion facilitator family transporter